MVDMPFQEPVPGIPDAVNRRADALPDFLPGAQIVDPMTQAKPGEMLLNVPGAGRFLIRGGLTVDYAPEADADPGFVKLLLNGSARGALIHQRGELPLHAATLSPPESSAAIAICGPSGAGKSTLASELVARGWRLVADDTTRLTWDGANASAWPSRDTIKLWKDICDRKEIDVSGLERVTKTLDKYYLPVEGIRSPQTLGAIVELVPDAEGAVTSLPERMSLVTRNTFRQRYVMPLGMAKAHVRVVTSIVSAVRIYRLRGRRDVSVASLADEFEAMIN